jgi:hypothetical protein
LDFGKNRKVKSDKVKIEEEEKERGIWIVCAVRRETE